MNRINGFVVAAAIFCVLAIGFILAAATLSCVTYTNTLLIDNNAIEGPSVRSNGHWKG